MSTQSRIASIAEAFVNQAIGFVISVVINHIALAYFFELDVHAGHSIGLTLIFMCVGLIRSYVIRRFFNART